MFRFVLTLVTGSLKIDGIRTGKYSDERKHMAQRLAHKATRPRTGKVTVTKVDEPTLEDIDTTTATEATPMDIDFTDLGDTDGDEGTEPTPPEGDTDDDIVTPKEMARRLGTDAKSFRRWLRTYTPDRVNKGGRWKLTPATADKLEAAYKARNKKATEVTLPPAD